MRQGGCDRRASGGRVSRQPAREEGQGAGDGAGDRAQGENENRAGAREGGPMTAASVGRLTVDRSDSSATAAAASRPRSRLQTRSGRRFLLAAALAAVLSIAFTMWIGFRVGGDQSVTVVDDIGEAMAAMVAAASCGYASWRAIGRMRLAWGLLAASALSWGIGETTWSGVYTTTGNVTDAGWVIGYFLIALAPFWPAPFADRASKEGPADLWQMSVPWLSLLGAAVLALALAATGHGLDVFLTAVGGG